MSSACSKPPGARKQDISGPDSMRDTFPFATAYTRSLSLAGGWNCARTEAGSIHEKLQDLVDDREPQCDAAVRPTQAEVLKRASEGDKTFNCRRTVGWVVAQAPD